MLLYVAGAYSSPSEEDRRANVKLAGRVAGELWDMEHAVICPHANTNEWDVTITNSHRTYDNVLKGDLMMVARCDGIVMLPNWNTSKGARMEHAYAAELGIPIWYYPDIPPLHVTEINNPAQCKMFAEILGKMYRTHLDKNADYSPANILATGEVGLVTRLWDKTARLMNLVGIKFKYLLHENVSPPKNPKNESINDSLLDLAVYAIIGLLLRQGKWGR